MDDRHDILVKTLIFLGFAMNSQDLRVRPLLRGLPEYHLCVYIYIYIYIISIYIYFHLLSSIYAHQFNLAIPIFLKVHAPIYPHDCR